MEGIDHQGFPNLIILLRLHRLYHYAYDRMHCRARPMKLYYHEAEKEILLGWVRENWDMTF